MQNNYAGFAARLAAWLIDALVTFVPLSILRGVGFAVSAADPYSPLVSAVLFRYSPIDIAGWLLPVAYFVAMTWSQGATLGKMALKLKIIGADGGRATLWQLILRETVGRYLSAAILCIGYFMMIPDAQKRALHDRIADTRVIYDLPEPRAAAVAAPESV